MGSTNSINTAKVAGRRTLRFESFDEVQVELVRLERVEVELLGNWSLGQIYAHLARGFDGAIDGIPQSMAPWYMKLLGPVVKKRILRGRMGAGFKIPRGAESAMVAPRSVSAEQSLADLRTAIERFLLDTQRQPHPVFGTLNEEEWEQLMLRHCELHLSFVLPLNSGHHG